MVKREILKIAGTYSYQRPILASGSEPHKGPYETHILGSPYGYDTWCGTGVAPYMDIFFNVPKLVTGIEIRGGDAQDNAWVTSYTVHYAFYSTVYTTYMNSAAYKMPYEDAPGILKVSFQIVFKNVI